MKYLFLIFITLTTLFTSCKKDKEASNTLIGQWRWVLSIGGFTGSDTVKPSAGSIVSLTLNRDSTYVIYLNNQVNFQGRFSVKKNSSTTIIYFDTTLSADNLHLESEESVSVTGNEMELFDQNISEGYNHKFIMVK